ncbi:MAG TPA: long-chain fatty acid--CoA ligase [Actinomycetota bacterium]|nr:long-chain fatty acid--CoA ligase [Actinomycetota bacterium]
MGDRPWLASYPPDVPRSLAPYPEKSAYSLLEETAARFPDRPAVSFFGKRLTYRQLADEVDRCARWLTSLGVGKGDRVGLVLPNCPQYVAAFYGGLKIGAVVTGNNPLYTERELAHQLRDAGARVVIALDQLAPRVEAVRGEAGVETVVVTKITDYMPFPINRLAPLKFKKEARAEGRPWPPVPEGADVLWWSDLMKRSLPEAPRAEVDAKQDVACLLYTGGTTGLSKGAMLTHYNLVSNLHQTTAWFPGLRDGEEAVMCVLPFFHSYGLQVAMNMGILKGAKLVLMPRFELEMVLKAVKKERPTLFPGVPRIYGAINDSAETKKYDVSSIRACLSGAAPLPLAIAERFEELTGARLVEGYGLTETSPVTHANPIEGDRRAGSIGLPLPDTDCKIVDVDDPDRVVEPGEEGELAVAGPQVMKGYWNRDDETEAMIRTDADGVRWLHTGDIAKMDEDGYFYIVDRKKDMIIVSGFNVYPTEIEQVLYRHPKIAKVGVVGIPDDKTGEAVKAYVVLKPGESATPEEIVAWCRDDKQGLTGYRAPKHVEFRDSLPETMVGKLLRRVLAEEERQKREAAASQ